MVVLRYKKLGPNEEGYLLLESLLTLVILMAVVTILCPLAVNWLSKHQAAKSFVEENRKLYESSAMLNTNDIKQQGAGEYKLLIEKHRLQIKETGTEVVIYESVFEN